jgi:hypothetical protein
MRPSVPSGWRGTGADSVFVGTRFCTNDGTLLGLQTAIPQRGQRSDWSGTRHGGISVDPIPLADFPLLTPIDRTPQTNLGSLSQQCIHLPYAFRILAIHRTRQSSAVESFSKHGRGPLYTSLAKLSILRSSLRAISLSLCAQTMSQ